MLPSSSSSSEISNPSVTPAKGCFVCGSQSCQLVTHRLTTLESLRRLARQAKPSKRGTPTAKPTNKEIQPSSSTSASGASPVNINPSNPLSTWLEGCVPFPLRGTRKHLVGRFHDFFGSQARELHQTPRSMCFDTEHLPYLLPIAMESPALCMSIVAMSATYAGVHSRDLTAPDAEVLTIYGDTFQALRNQVESEANEGVSEASIVAAINLVMCCGIGFQDREAALAHWQGLLALLERPRSKLYGGPIMALRNSLEHWLVLTCGLEPRDDTWISPLNHQSSPAEIYGHGFENVFQFLAAHDMNWEPRLFQLCVNTCRATEVLESQANNIESRSRGLYETYFPYLRGVVLQQGMIVHHRLENSNTVQECISISMDVFCVTVLCLTPWKAPVRYLCHEFRRAYARSMKTFDHTPRNGIRMMYIWMLCLSTYAGWLCQDPDHVEWAVQMLGELYLQDLDNPKNGWETTLLRILKSFCWSDVFLSHHFQTLCSLLRR